MKKILFIILVGLIFSFSCQAQSELLGLNVEVLLKDTRFIHVKEVPKSTGYLIALDNVVEGGGYIYSFIDRGKCTAVLSISVWPEESETIRRTSNKYKYQYYYRGNIVIKVSSGVPNPYNETYIRYYYYTYYSYSEKEIKHLKKIVNNMILLSLGNGR